MFSAGFVLGTVRTVWLAPAFGQFLAVAVELPFILAVSWIACGWCMRRFCVSGMRQRARMGAVAFIVLMVAEAALAFMAFGMSVADYCAGFLTASGALGLVGQAVFAIMPLFHPGRRPQPGD